MTAAIEVSGLVKRYGGRAVVDGIDLTVARGEAFALLGPNGAGKTTTIEILEGYRRADGGSVRVLGLEPSRDGAALRPRIGLMLQDGGIYRQARPRELLALFGAFYRNPHPADDLLERVGLAGAASRAYRVLSGGEKQRLSLALALVGRPELLFLDEPTAGMDPAARVETRALLTALRADGVTVVLTTHDLADVETVADRVAIIARGRIVAEGTPGSLGAQTSTDLVVRFARPLADPELTALRAFLPAADIDPRADSARFAAAGGDAALIALVSRWCADHAIPIAELRSTGGTLEERYLALVGEEAAA